MNYICLSVETTPKLHFNSFWKYPCIIYFQKCYIIKNIPCRWYHAVLMVWLTLTQHRWMFLWLKQKAWNKGTCIPAVSVSHVMTARRQIKSGSLCKQLRKAWIREKVFEKCAAGLCRVRLLLPCPCRLWNSTRFFMLVASANFCALPPLRLCPWLWSLAAAGTQCPALSLARPLLKGCAAPQELWSSAQISAEVEQLPWWWNSHTFHREGFCAIVSLAGVAYLQKSWEASPLILCLLGRNVLEEWEH